MVAASGWFGRLRLPPLQRVIGGADGFLVACVAFDHLTVDVTSGLAGGLSSIPALLLCLCMWCLDTWLGVGVFVCDMALCVRVALAASKYLISPAHSRSLLAA